MSSKPAPAQPDLFGVPPASADTELVRPATVDASVAALAKRLPARLHLGTSTWSFSGWAGLVYADLYEPSLLARHGLAAYARHPLLTTVGIDRTFYGPISAEDFRRYAEAVPEQFRFLVKAWSAITTSPESARNQSGSFQRSAFAEDAFLDAEEAIRSVIEPAVEGLGDKLGVIVFQFSPLGTALTRTPREFVAQLAAFLEALPVGPAYAVELRDPEVLGVDYEAALAAAGVTHCATVHPRMPPPDTQAPAPADGPLAVRWNLHRTQSYEGARAHYAPFDRLVDADPDTRRRIVRLVTSALAADREVYVVANNKAEGSAPLTLVELARAIAATL